MQKCFNADFRFNRKIQILRGRGENGYKERKENRPRVEVARGREKVQNIRRIRTFWNSERTCVSSLLYRVSVKLLEQSKIG